MNVRVIYRVANVIVLSLLRAGRAPGRTRGSIVASLINRARLIAVLDAVVFASVSILAYQVLIRIPGSLTNLYPTVTQALAGVPVWLISGTVLFGIMWEISQPAQFSSSDVVNWLPVRVTEYVLGCALSTVYTISFILAGVAGIALGVGVWTGQTWNWIPYTIINVVAMFLGAFAIEIIRAVINRASSSFYKRGGRSTIAIRLVAIMLFVVLIQLMFQPQLYLSFFQVQAEGAKSLWFLPLFWPSLATGSILEAQAAPALAYSALTAAFTGVVFCAAVLLRGKYWVPTQVSIRVSSGVYTPKTGVLGKIGFTSLESAIIRKDLKAMTRRTEMIRFLSIPAAITIPMILSAGQPGWVQKGTLVLMIFYAITFLALFVSMISVGQEGGAVWHLYASATDYRNLVRAKTTVTLLITLIPAMILSLVAAWFSNMNLLTSLQLCMASALFAAAETFIGLAVGTRHPSFQEVPRSRFITASGMLIGLAAGGGVAIAVATPVFYSFFVAPSSPIAPFVLPIVIAETLTLSFVGYHLAKSGAKKLLIELCT